MNVRFSSTVAFLWITTPSTARHILASPCWQFKTHILLLFCLSWDGSIPTIIAMKIFRCGCDPNQPISFYSCTKNTSSRNHRFATRIAPPPLQWDCQTRSSTCWIRLAIATSLAWSSNNFHLHFFLPGDFLFILLSNRKLHSAKLVYWVEFACRWDTLSCSCCVKLSLPLTSCYVCGIVCVQSILFW